MDGTWEKIRIIEMVAYIILQDIRTQFCEKGNYQIPNFRDKDFLTNVLETLKVFLDTVIKSHEEKTKSNQLKLDRKIAVLSQCIISAKRPNLWKSTLLLGLSCMFHKKYESKDLIESLFNAGLSASYNETQKFDLSIIKERADHVLLPDAYIQFVFDNADHDTRTIDGTHTFYAMGGVLIATPASSVITKK